MGKYLGKQLSFRINLSVQNSNSSKIPFKNKEKFKQINEISQNLKLAELCYKESFKKIFKHKQYDTRLKLDLHKETNDLERR